MYLYLIGDREFEESKRKKGLRSIDAKVGTRTRKEKKKEEMVKDENKGLVLEW